MQRSRLALRTPLLLALAAAACGGDDAGPTTRTSPPPAAAAAVDPASIADPATLSGRVAFGGDAPQAQVLQMAADPLCLAAHGGVEVTAQRLVVNDDGTLRHVFVYVKEGLDQTFTTPSEAVELSQVGCMYTPHMLGVQTHQTLTISNQDASLHNVNAQPAGNSPFNFAQPPNIPPNDVVFDAPEIMIPIKCDVHPWMQAYVGVVAHPFFAVTGEDGTFTIEGLPAGDYVIAAWHETLGEQTRSVSVAANGTAELAFELGG